MQIIIICYFGANNTNLQFFFNLNTQKTPQVWGLITCDIIGSNANLFIKLKVTV
ncbi:Uncharacterised protein [Vibrio cholerae]|nr:Uncharacterised protein [Vibrio cholerae]